VTAGAEVGFGVGFAWLEWKSGSEKAGENSIGRKMTEDIYYFHAHAT